jgi:N-acetylmuramoyl-L-alanine amidase
LKELLEENDIKVIMTRKDQYGLYRKDSVNKKKEDMEKRVSIKNSSDAIITVSIHQNSYSQEYCKGAQVFYHSKSEKGKILAEIIQNKLKETLNDGNKREVKPNSSYYLLRYSKCPLVIVECGFLSNRKEADLLCEDYYQDKVAWAIHLGIMEYINQFIS